MLTEYARIIIIVDINKHLARQNRTHFSMKMKSAYGLTIVTPRACYEIILIITTLYFGEKRESHDIHLFTSISAQPF